MEALIWKYLDGQCDENEVIEVQHLLDVDTAFRTLFEQCALINTQLQDATKISMSEAIKLSLIDAIVKPRNMIYAKAEIMPVPWVIGLSVTTLAVILFSLSYLGQDSQFVDLSQLVDDKSLKFTTYSLMGFIVLLVMDKLFKTSTGRIWNPTQRFMI